MDPGLQGGKVGYIDILGPWSPRKEGRIYRIYLDLGLQGGKVGYTGYTRILVSRKGRGDIQDILGSWSSGREGRIYRI